MTAVTLLFSVATVPAEAKLSDEKMIVLLRDLTAEMGTAQVVLPRSKKSLDILPDGTYDQRKWTLCPAGPSHSWPEKQSPKRRFHRD